MNLINYFKHGLFSLKYYTVKFTIFTVFLIIFLVSSVVLFHRIPIIYTFDITEEIKPVSVFAGYKENSVGYSIFDWYAFVIRYIADRNDTVILNINSPGGEISAGLRLVSAIEESMAHTIARVDTKALSMAAIIAISANELEFTNPDDVIGFHMAYIPLPDGSKYINIREPGSLKIKFIFLTKLIDILTQEQIDVYNRGGAVYFKVKNLKEKLIMIGVFNDLKKSMYTLNPKIYTPQTIEIIKK